MILARKAWASFPTGTWYFGIQVFFTISVCPVTLGLWGAPEILRISYSKDLLLPLQILFWALFISWEAGRREKDMHIQEWATFYSAPISLLGLLWWWPLWVAHCVNGRTCFSCWRFDRMGSLQSLSYMQLPRISCFLAKHYLQATSCTKSLVKLMYQICLGKGMKQEPKRSHDSWDPYMC